MNKLRPYVDRQLIRFGGRLKAHVDEIAVDIVFFIMFCMIWQVASELIFIKQVTATKIIEIEKPRKV